MATVLPPPSKKQRTEAAERSREQQDIEEVPRDTGSLRLQFFDETTGLPIGQGPVLVPVADANPKNLELLLNTLQGHVSKTAVGIIIHHVLASDHDSRTPPSIFPIDSRSQCQTRRAQILSRQHFPRTYGRL
jgi:ribosome assembly protein 4